MIGADIRSLMAADYAAAFAIIKRVYPEYPEIHAEFTQRFNASLNPQTGSYSLYWVGAFENETLCGFAAFAQSSMSDSCWELSWNSIDPVFQGKGLGTALIQHRLAEIAKLSTFNEAHIFVHTMPTRLYAEAGFAPVFEGTGKAVLWKTITTYA